MDHLFHRPEKALAAGTAPDHGGAPTSAQTPASALIRRGLLALLACGALLGAPAAGAMSAIVSPPATATSGASTNTAAPTISSPTTTYVPSSGVAPTGTGPATTAPAGTLPRTPTISGAAPAPVTGAPAAAARQRSTGHGKRISTGAIILAALAVLLILGCVAWGVARHRGIEPRWWLSLRHSSAEAGLRAADTWAEFTDWVRLGR